MRNLIVRLFIVIMGMTSLLSCTRTAPPNVVMIIVDTLRADKLGAYGFSLPTSPEIDSIASRGVKFSRVIAQASWTRASIGSFLTSQYPRTLGIYKEQWDVLPTHFTTLAEVLKQHGYQTVGVTANPNINSSFHFNQGIDSYIDSNVVFPWMKTENGKERATSKKRLTRAAMIFEKALSELKRTEVKSDPIYLQINIMDVHDWSDIKEVDPDLDTSPDRQYLQSVRIASAEIGKFIEQLAAVDRFKNTLFVIVSDHGEGLTDHPDIPDSLRHGTLLYESQVVVPLILFNPGDPNFKGNVKRPVRLLDLMPTVLSYLKIEIPSSLEGVSLLPLLADEKTPIGIPDQIFTETEWRTTHKEAMYGEQWIYVENRDNWEGVNPTELQEVGKAQNGKKTDRASEHPEVVKQMGEALKNLENEIPLATSQQNDAPPSSDEINQLKSLGYLK